MQQTDICSIGNRVLDDFMSVLKNCIPDVVPIQKCHECGFISQWLWDCRYLKFKMIWTLLRTSGSFLCFTASKFDNVFPVLCLFYVHTPCLSCGVRSSDHRSKFCGSSWLIHCPEIGMPCYTGSVSVIMVFVIHIIFNLCP